MGGVDEEVAWVRIYARIFRRGGREREGRCIVDAFAASRTRN